MNESTSPEQVTARSRFLCLLMKTRRLGEAERKNKRTSASSPRRACLDSNEQQIQCAGGTEESNYVSTSFQVWRDGRRKRKSEEERLGGTVKPICCCSSPSCSFCQIHKVWGIKPPGRRLTDVCECEFLTFSCQWRTPMMTRMKTQTPISAMAVRRTLLLGVRYNFALQLEEKEIKHLNVYFVDPAEIPHLSPTRQSCFFKKVLFIIWFCRTFYFGKGLNSLHHIRLK